MSYYGTAQGGHSEEDISRVLQRMRVEHQDQLVNFQRKLERVSEENSSLRKVLDESLSQTEDKIRALTAKGDDSSASTWADPNWADVYGGSPTTTPKKKEAEMDPKELDKLVDQKMAERERKRIEAYRKAQVRDTQDSVRLWEKFKLEHPDLVQDPAAVGRISNQFKQAKALNSRAASSNRLTADQLYAVVVQNVRNEMSLEREIRNRQTQQQQAQQQQAMAGPNGARPAQNVGAAYGQSGQGQFPPAGFVQQNATIPPNQNSPYGQTYEQEGHTLQGAQRRPAGDPIPIQKPGYASGYPSGPSNSQGTSRDPFGDIGTGNVDPRVALHQQRLAKGPLPQQMFQ